MVSVRDSNCASRRGLLDSLIGVTIGMAAVACYVAAIAFALTQIYGTTDLSIAEKTMWTVAVLCAPVIAGIIWFAAGPHPLGLRVIQTRS